MLTRCFSCGGQVALASHYLWPTWTLCSGRRITDTSTLTQFLDEDTGVGQIVEARGRVVMGYMRPLAVIPRINTTTTVRPPGESMDVHDILRIMRL